MKRLLTNDLFKSSFVYTGINFFNKVFPFILLPIFTREFTLDEYGVYNLIKASVGVLTPLIGFNVSESIVRNYFGFDKNKFSDYIITGLLIVLCFATIMFIVLLIIPDALFLELFQLKSSYLIIALLISYFTAVNNVERGLLRCEGNNKLFAILVLSQSILYFAICLTLYFSNKLNLMSVLIIELSTFIIFGFISLALLIYKYKLRLRFNIIYIKDILKYSAPLALNSMLAYLFALSDRFLISNRLENSAVALYSATFQVVSILQILAVSFNAAWVPYVYNVLNSENFSLQSFKRKRNFVMIAFLGISIIYSFFLYNFLVVILGEKYSGGSQLILWMVISNLFQCFYWVVAPVIQFYKKNWLFLFASLPALLVNLSLNTFFLKDGGIIFAAIANSIAWSIYFIITFYNSNKLLITNEGRNLSKKNEEN